MMMMMMPSHTVRWLFFKAITLFCPVIKIVMTSAEPAKAILILVSMPTIRAPLRSRLTLHKSGSIARLNNCPESGQPCLNPLHTGIALNPPPALTITKTLEYSN